MMGQFPMSCEVDGNGVNSSTEPSKTPPSAWLPTPEGASFPEASNYWLQPRPAPHWWAHDDALALALLEGPPCIF